MVITSRIGEDFVWTGSRGDDRTLGVVEFSIFPHVDHQEMPHDTMAAAVRWAGRYRRAGVRDRTTQPPSRWSTAPSRSSPRAAGAGSGPSRPAADDRPAGLPVQPAARSGAT